MSAKKIMEVCNTHQQLVEAEKRGLPPVAITIARSGARNDYVSGVVVYHIRLQSDPNAHWTRRGCKHFSLMSRAGNFAARLAFARAEAEAWAAEKYGVKEWQRNRDRSSVPSPINDLYPIRK